MSRLPVGFRFDPTDEELLFYYLQRKVKGESLPPNVVPECDIYGDKEPWKVFDENSTESFYVFTKLKKKSKLRVDRKAGCGTWAGRQTNNVKDDNGNNVGFDKYFVFEDKKGSRTSWIMHEFSLLDEELNDYVICEIRNKDSTDKDKAQMKDLKHPIDNNQGRGRQRSKKRNLNPGQKNQQRKRKRITSIMDNIDVENRKDNGDPSSLPSNIISEPSPIQKSEPASSSHLEYFANLFKEEDIMDSYWPLSNLITEPAPAQYIRPTSSSYDSYIAYEFGKDMMDSYIMEPHLPQSSFNLEPVPALEWTPMKHTFDVETIEAIDTALQSYWVYKQPPIQGSENMFPSPTSVSPCQHFL